MFSKSLHWFEWVVRWVQIIMGLAFVALALCGVAVEYSAIFHR